MKNKLTENTNSSSGKSWLQRIASGLKVAGNVATIVLSTPLKLPSKVLQIAQYLAVLAGIVKATENKQIDESE